MRLVQSVQIPWNSDPESYGTFQAAWSRDGEFALAGKVICGELLRIVHTTQGGGAGKTKCGVTERASVRKSRVANPWHSMLWTSKVAVAHARCVKREKGVLRVRTIGCFRLGGIEDSMQRSTKRARGPRVCQSDETVRLK